uniref:Uncharacterized protein LOC105050138 isoform X1 n=1 Tax=Elaeis guineensis var. tenera TaxID=51953 RepID=A0A6J0PLN5_ELAGV|nr:uncharacterized protein LOC105050138 isoform X1 [Elaeis guineensis]
MEAGSDSDVPEELMAQEGIKQDEEIRKVPRENIIRVAQEGKERRRQWAQRKPQLKSSTEHTIEVKETEQHQEATYISGMLPSNIVEALAAHEKLTFSSDSEEEIINHKPATRKKKQKSSGPETVILKDIPPARCMQNSVEFLTRRKMQAPRSTSVLKNANQGN